MAPPARAEAIPPAIAPNINHPLKWLETNNLFNNLIQRNQSAAFSSGKVRPNHETNINIIARRTGKDVNSHTVLDGIITTIMATIQRINIIGSREGSRNRRGLETLVIIMVANKYAFLQITRRRFLNEWEAFKKVISRRNIRRRITIPLTLSNLKLLRRITRTENILHRNFTRRQVAIQNRVASNIGISQSTFSVKVLNLFSRSRRKTNKRKSKHSAMLRNKETRHRMFIGLLNTTRKLA